MRKEALPVATVSKRIGDEDFWVFYDGNDKLPGSRLSPLLASKDKDLLVSSQGSQVDASALEGKVVGLYFSANWYPLCQQFTRVLASVYAHLKERGDPFEIVFVSADENMEAFNSYRATMPWLAIPFSNLNLKKNLNRKYNIEGIPSLIILQPWDEEDELVRYDGVDLVYRYGARAFPFTKEKLKLLEDEEKEKHERQTLVNLLTNHSRDYLLANSSPKPESNESYRHLAGLCSTHELGGSWSRTQSSKLSFHQRTHELEEDLLGWRIDMSGSKSCSKVTVASLVGKTVGLYFSAQWCLPGLKFTPKLITVYHNIKQSLVNEQDQDFEIVLVSSDRDQSLFDLYFSSMPWLALPFGDPTIKNLTKYFDVQGIPCLVIIGPDGKTLTKQGRMLINLHLEKAYPFTQKQLESLEKEMEEEAKSFPRTESHEGHPHQLTLVTQGSGGGPFICCMCDEQGSGWAYLCLECGYEVHPRCVKAVSKHDSGS